MNDRQKWPGSPRYRCVTSVTSQFERTVIPSRHELRSFRRFFEDRIPVTTNTAADFDRTQRLQFSAGIAVAIALSLQSQEECLKHSIRLAALLLAATTV